MLLEFFTSLVLFFILWFVWENRNRKTSPPGPLRFPLLGTLPQIAAASPTSYLALDQLSKKYGDLMSAKMGMVDAVVVASYDAVKDLCNKEETHGRQCEGIWWDRNLQQNIGLGFSNGEPWVRMQKFCRDTLRQYGFGNREAMQNLVMEELVELVKCVDEDRLQNTQGRVTFSVNYLHRSFSNLVGTMMMGKRMNYDDPELLELLDHGHNFIKNGIFGAGILTAFPFLKSVFPEALGYTTQIGAAMGIQRCAKRLLDQRKKGDYAGNPRCFADNFLIKMDEEASSPKPLFTEDNFKVVFSDLMQGGSDTTGNYVNFTLLLLLAHPLVQEKLYREIIDVCGIDRQPNLADKASMPYTQAVLLESLRWGRILVHGLPRMVTQEFQYRGYTFKKGSILMMNFHTIFFDEKFWEDPNVFRPERFLDGNGRIIKNKEERILAFGSGKRKCIGEVLARDSGYLFVTTLVQKFKFTLPPGENPNLEPMLGITLGPHPYDALVSLRLSN